MRSYCEDTHLITWELFQAVPAITYSSRVDTIQLRRVTTNKQTLLEWSTRFSGDATTNVLEDCKYKKREAFRDLRNTLGGAVTGGKPEPCIFIDVKSLGRLITKYPKKDQP